MATRTGPSSSSPALGTGAAGAAGAGVAGGVAGSAAGAPPTRAARSGSGLGAGAGVRSIEAATVERSKGGATLSAGRFTEVASAPRTRSQR